MQSGACSFCKKPFTRRWQSKFCSNQCQANFRYKAFLHEWIKNNKNIVTKNISGHIKRFLLEKDGEQCSRCVWKERNPSTGRVPLEVDHIDGNAENNQRKNVRLLCPNCHALTPSFRNLNRGKGRTWRKKNTSLKTTE